MLDRLPIECVALIVRNSPLHTLMHCTATCQACHAVAALDDVWRDHFHRTAGEQVATDWCAAQRLPTEPPLGYRAAFRAYCLSGSPIVVQLEPTRTLVGFAKEGVSNVRVLECGVRSNGVLVPGRFEAMGQALLGVLGLHTLHSMSVCVLVAPLDGAAELRGLMACLFGLGAARLRLLDAAVAVLAAFDGPGGAGETVGTVLSVEYDGVCAACVAGGKRLPLPERPRRQAPPSP